VAAFHRPPRVREIIQPVEVELPAAPTPPRNLHRTPLARVLLMTLLPALLPPVALGLATYALGQSSTVIVTSMALSGSLGIAVVITTLMSRRDEDIRNRAEQAEYESKLRSYQATLRRIDAECQATIGRERRILAAQFPGNESIAVLATTRSVGLWERRPGDDDFLRARLGVGSRSSCIRFKRSSTGEDERAADELVGRHQTLTDVPVTAEFTGGTTKGAIGQSGAVNDLLRSFALQLATQHAPSEVRLAVFSRDEALCGWAKWLPHCRLSSTRESVPLVGRTGVEASAALRAISHELSSRSGTALGPVYVILADGRNWDSLPSRLSRWLPPAHPAVCIVSAEERFEDLPGSCDEVFDLTGDGGRALRKTEPASPPTFTSDAFDDRSALNAALEITDLVEAGDVLRTPVPRSARLLDLLGSDALDPEGIAAAWERSRRAFRLAAPIGFGPNDSIVEIDLRRDGPHGLLAGTTGSGKSEFLQSLVASLSVRISPDLLNFVLIDYKGGSAFKEMADLPQVVGVVTDLDDRLAQRALESLRAELRRREHLLAAVVPSAANIIEYQAQRRAVPLANLVIIIDEFHRLVSEQPQFIEEMVRIAQQGRSLGVHLLLSTQKPSGVVTDQIRANTNLRMALRVTDEADSRDVLGTTEAAGIPRDLPGRIYVRVGNEPLRVCQAGRISGLVPKRDVSSSAVTGKLFLEAVRTKVVRRNGIAARLLPRAADLDADDDEEDRELTDERLALVAAVSKAAALSGLPAQAAPWLEPLPTSVTLDQIASLVVGDLAPTQGAVGVLDEPELQRQRPYVMDLAAGHILIAGGANSGKTTALLALADAFARRCKPDELHIYGIDYAGGQLAPLDRVANSGGVAAQHQWPRVQWVLQALKDIIDERLAGHDSTPRAQMLVLVDNFNGLWNGLQDTEPGQDLSDDLVRLMDIGRAVGVTFAITTERPDTIRPAVMATMATRLALPSPDPDLYSALGLGRQKTASEPIRGRALLIERVPHEVQLALPETSDAAVARETFRGGPLRIAPLPESVTYEEVLALAGELQTNRLLLGLREGTRPLFSVPADEHLLVIGPRRSGRSNTLAVVVRELERLGFERITVLNPRRSALLREACGEAVDYHEGPDETLAALQQLASEIQAAFQDDSETRQSTRWGIVVDDIDCIELPFDAAEQFQKLALRGSDVGVTLSVAGDSQSLRASYPSGFVRTLLNRRRGILIAPLTSEDYDLLGVRGKPRRLGPGCGFLCEAGIIHNVQMAIVREAHSD